MHLSHIYSFTFTFVLRFLFTLPHYMKPSTKNKIESILIVQISSPNLISIQLKGHKAYVAVLFYSRGNQSGKICKLQY